MARAEEIPTTTWIRRFLALLVDWGVSTLVVVWIIGTDAYTEPGSRAGFLVLGVYVAESALFTWLLAGSFGKLVTGLRVVPADGPLRPHNPLLIVVRQIMVALVIPPLVFRSDGRGLHDLIANTKTVRAQDMRAAIGADR